MAEMLLINPRKRRASTAKRRASTAKRRTSSAKRRRNPLPATTVSTARRRRMNPIRAKRRSTRRRRNPIGAGFKSSAIVTMIKDALIGGAGAVAMDVAMGQINGYLPTMLQRTPGSVGAGDAVKAAITVALGQILAKPTKGLSRKMAAGALTVQAAELIKSMVPATLPLGYAVPAAAVTSGVARVGPIKRPGIAGVGAYTRAGATQLLSGVGAYTRPGASQLLSGASKREGVRFR